MAQIKHSPGLTLQFLSVLITGLALMLWIQTVDAQSCNGLSHHFYYKSCPKAQAIIKSVVEDAVRKEARMAASLLRLHFHDCFVKLANAVVIYEQCVEPDESFMDHLTDFVHPCIGIEILKGCDGSILLDDTSSFTGEKTANPNRNSVRGFGVVDQIKSELEKACPGVVSCADILAVAARDSVGFSGGPFWKVLLGRRDSRSASKSGANNDIPGPNSTHQTLETKFKRQGLNVVDLVALSGAHTIGLARCSSFKARLYNQTVNGKPDPTLDTTYLKQLRAVCPQTGTDDNQTTPLDPVTPIKFDIDYYDNVVAGKGLLASDEILYSTKGSRTVGLVESYSTSTHAFFKQFAASMIKMGNINPLTGSHGEIRKNCRRMN